MAVTKTMFSDWKNHVVTQELMSELQGNMEGYIAEMVNRKLPDPEIDTWVRAYVRAATEVLEFEPTIVEEDQFKEVEDVED